jgi:hypothetical protein
MRLLIASSCLFLLLANSLIYADSPRLKEAVKITDIRIIGNPTKGKDVLLRVSYFSLVDGDGSAMMSFPSGFAPVDKSTGEQHRLQNLTLSKGQISHVLYPMRVERDGNAAVFISVRAHNAPQGFVKSDSRFLSIQSSDSTFVIIDERNPSGTSPIEVQAQTGDAPQLGRSQAAQVMANYSVSISGRVRYIDELQFDSLGVYGLTAQLWFRNTGAPEFLYHPVYAANCYGNRYVHYDVVDANGNYHFNFSFSGDLSGYNQAIVILTRDNASTYMAIQESGIRVWCNNSYRDFFGFSEGFVASINGSNPIVSLPNANVQINSKDGAIFRNLMLSREFVLQLYGGSLILPRFPGHWVSVG